MQHRAQPRIDQRYDGHQVAIGPRFPNLDVEPLAEHGIGKTECQREDNDSPLAVGGPYRGPRQEKCQHDCTKRDQYVSTRAVQRGEDDLATRSRLPQGIERHVGELPDEVRARDERHVAP